MYRIDLIELLKNEYTYPNWSTSTKYKLETQIINEEEILVFYHSTKTIMKKIFKRKFPRYIYLTPGFCWVLGFFKGEGLSSIRGKSYRRFVITNKNPICLNKFLDELEKSKLLLRSAINGKCFQIHHFLNHPDEVIDYWSNKLKFPRGMFSPLNYDDGFKKEGNGVCHFDIGDVLLRKVFDSINNKIMTEAIAPASTSGEWI